jgi:hypothetical protein
MDCVVLPLSVMLLQKAIASDTVMRIISSCSILFAAARVMHVVWLASCFLSCFSGTWYRSACYISAACMRFAWLYIALHTCGIRMCMKYDLLWTRSSDQGRVLLLLIG